MEDTERGLFWTELSGEQKTIALLIPPFPASPAVGTFTLGVKLCHFGRN